MTKTQAILSASLCAVSAGGTLALAEVGIITWPGQSVVPGPWFFLGAGMATAAGVFAGAAVRGGWRRRLLVSAATVTVLLLGGLGSRLATEVAPGVYASSFEGVPKKVFFVGSGQPRAVRTLRSSYDHVVGRNWNGDWDAQVGNVPPSFWMRPLRWSSSIKVWGEGWSGPFGKAAGEERATHVLQALADDWGHEWHCRSKDRDLECALARKGTGTAWRCTTGEWAVTGLRVQGVVGEGGQKCISVLSGSLPGGAELRLTRAVTLPDERTGELPEDRSYNRATAERSDGLERTDFECRRTESLWP